MNNEEIIKVLRQKLGEKRLKHTFGVAKCAKELAIRFGADPEKAYTAGLLHDIVKEDTVESMLSLCKNLNLDDEMKASRALLHGPAGAEFARRKFGVDDEIYNACFYHTVGRANMSLLEKIVYVADCIEENRTQPGVEELREIAKTDLDACLLQAVENTIAYLKQNNMKIHKNSIETRNYLLKSAQKCDKIK